MPRHARLVMPGFPHHVTQRGNYRQKVFESLDDYRKYCYWIRQYADEYQVKIIAYCLMDNHVHFIVTPSDSTGLAQLFKIVHMKYSYYKNQSQSKVGHLWQGRFFSSILDEAYLIRAVRYVERNPVRAGIVGKPWEYIWSSTREHMDLEKEPIIKTCNFDQVLQLVHLKEWKDYIAEDDPVMTKRLRIKSPIIGTEDFISSMEQKTGYRLRPLKRGPKN